VSEAPADAVIWHDVECGMYTADLPLWRELAERAEGPVLEVGAGTGRVALDLARRGHPVTALDRDSVLLEALERRAGGLPVDTVAADARDFSLDRRFPLVIAPMQTVQLLGGPRGREAFLRCAREHLSPGGLLAAAIAGGLEPFDATVTAELPVPDMAEHGGWVYSSQPVAIRRAAGGATVIERLRQAVSPRGEHHAERDEVRLDALDAAAAAAEARAVGYDPDQPVEIAPTHEHVGSTVALLRR
jgi:SAM-dependent methyltransferase